MIYFPFQYYTNLGNWLFQYAAALSIGQDVAGYMEYADNAIKVAAYPTIFGALKQVASLPPSVAQYEQPDFRYHPFPDKLKRGDWLIKGFYQTEKYFKDKDDIRRRFGPPQKVIDDLMQRYGTWLSQPNVTGISVRHGKDYLEIPYKFPFVGKKYFKDCIDKIPTCQHFVVCSDDLKWCKRFFPKAFPDKKFLFIENETVLNQLYIHVLCRHNIISNSSFSWWGAWLNPNKDKRVLAPSEWFGIMGVKEGLDWSDIYFDGVEVVNNRLNWLRMLNVYWHLFKKWFKLKFYPIKRFVSVTILGKTH